MSAVLLVTSTAATVSQQSANAADCPAPHTSGPLSAVTAPSGTPVVRCGLVDQPVTGNGVRLRIPPAGTGVYSVAEYPDGHNAEFGVYTTHDGRLQYVLDDGEAAKVTALASPSACNDSAYNTTNQKDSDFGWFLGDGALPSTLTRSQVRGVLVRTGNSLEASFNDCGLTDRLSLSISNIGDTTTESEIDNEDGESSCENYVFIDNYNTVDFGNLDDNGDPPLGQACTWWIPGASSYTAQDIRFNVTDFDWTTAPGSASCANDYDLRSVAIHEFGHALGMKHVSESAHGNLTMSTEVAPCTSSQRTLGRGDVLGLRTKY